ncbi:Lipid-A-disaccharide synthase [Candidatus Magnetomoraceae bacterium gMMP-1]
MNNFSKSIMIVAGEASGDLHGANLVRAMKTRDKELYFYGIGGKAMKEAGVRIIMDASELSVVGITEIFSKLPGIFKGMSVAKTNLREKFPNLLILIDFPEFNIHLAKTAKKIGVPILYYISPQIWAWRSGRVKKIKKLVDHIAVIFPFEAEFYKKENIPVTFVGHPLLEETTKHDHGKTLLPDNAGLRSNKLIIGLLPGSREGEIARHLPVMARAADILAGAIPNIHFLIPLAQSLDEKYLQKILTHEKFNFSPKFTIVSKGVKPVFKQASMIVTASGTATLEAGLAGMPMIIIYKVSSISYFIGRLLIKVDSIGLVNLVAGQKIVPELIQNDACPEKIAFLIKKFLDNPEKLERVKNKLKMIRKKLGEKGASMRTAEIALRLVNQNEK